MANHAPLAIIQLVDADDDLAPSPMIPGHPWRAPAGADECQSGAHHRHRGKAASREVDREFATDIESIAALVESGAFESFVPDLLSELGVA